VVLFAGLGFDFAEQKGNPGMRDTPYTVELGIGASDQQKFDHYGQFLKDFSWMPWASETSERARVFQSGKWVRGEALENFMGSLTPKEERDLQNRPKTPWAPD
jgi:hypothetical protein